MVVLMNDLWRTQFQSDPAILGKTITLNGFQYSVIGVMPPSFHLPVMQDLANNTDRAQPVEVLMPQVFDQDQLAAPMRDFNYFALGRLKPGVTVAQANAEINALQHSISASLPANEKGTLSALLTPFQEALVGDNRTPLLILLASVAGLLLVGCVNIANLLLSRAVGHRQQMAIAVALGARRPELLRMTMREPMLLAAVGEHWACCWRRPWCRLCKLSFLPRWTSAERSIWIGLVRGVPLSSRLGQLCWLARRQRGSDRERSRWRCCVASRARRANRAAISACAEPWWRWKWPSA